MPNTSSAAKRLRQNEKRRVMNRAVRTNMRTTIRRVRDAVANNDLETAKTEFKSAQKKLDRAAAKSLIHKHTAARTKSRLNALIKKAAQAA